MPAWPSRAGGVGPQHLLKHIFGPEPELGETLEDANANLQAIVWLWNTLVNDHERREVRLSPLPVGDPPSVQDLLAAVRRRSAEVTCFTRGIDASGDDPAAFGEDGDTALRRLGEAGAFLRSFEELLQRSPAAREDELRKTRRSVDDLTTVVETCIEDLLCIGDDVRRQAIAAFEDRGGATTDDGLPARRMVRVGRNDPCPCGSGKKWKRCCGGATTTQ